LITKFTFSSDGTISPHQITLLKLLDAYTHSESSSFDTNASIATFLPATLGSLLKSIKVWTAADPNSNTESQSVPNENLPPVAAATVLVSQALANGLIEQQLTWENSVDKAPSKRPMLEILRDPSGSLVELIIGTWP
jgi:hypothetical protein